jgi:hypothetical protein
MIFSLSWANQALSQTATCDYYASPTGGGNGLSSSSPFKISNFWAVANPGKTLCLLDGVYTGADSMINPPANLNGTATQRITVRALNDGGVRINGQGVNTPVILGNNDYFVLVGFDAHAGATEVVRLSGGADNNIVRRVCAWDANTNGNYTVFSMQYGSGNLLEDVCGFGIGRKIFSYYSSSGPLTVRRAWGMWNANAAFGGDGGSPKAVFNGVYNARNATWENVVGTWDGSAIGGYGVLVTDGFYQAAPGTDFCVKSNYLGSIGYLKSGNTVPTLIGVGYGSRSVDCFEFKDVVFHAGTTTQYPLQADVFDGGADGVATCAPNCNRKITNVTEIGSVPSRLNTSSNGWTATNRATGANVGSVPNIWNGAGIQGARVCHQYQNGTLTSTPLWPWPMDARIRQALTRSGRNPDTVFGGTGNGLTQLMESTFGTIPSVCRTSSLPTRPVNLLSAP